MELLWTVAGIFVLLAASIAATKIVVEQRVKQQLRARVTEFVPMELPAAPLPEPRTQKSNFSLPEWIEQPLLARLALAGWNARPDDLLLGSLCLFAGVLTALFVGMQVPLIFAVLVSSMVACIPFVCVFAQSQRTKKKMTLQLPNAIDLMVSVLRSGHSIPQSIKAVANEMPDPCGREFNEILQRVNLGQSLSEAMEYTVARYGSFELDLMKRAFHIHSEVGGSVSELLEKTNKTLRERIRLKRHIDVLTTPSKLTAIIVGCLPFILAIGFYLMAPNYLTPLWTTRMGQIFMVVALFLQLVGILIMQRLASFKV